MTDELTIQQKRPSALPYAVGGAAVGGLGGYYGLPKFAEKLVTDKGRYESYEQLIKEASDNDAFTRTIESAEGHEKEMLEKMKGVGDKIKNAEAEWQKGLDDFLASKGIKESTTEVVEEIVGEGTKKTTTIDKALRYHANKVDKLQEQLRSATTQEAKDAAKKALKEADDDFAKFIEQVIEQCEFKGSEAEIKTAKEALVKELKDRRSDISQHINREKTPALAEKVVKDFTAAQSERKVAQEALDDAFRVLEETLGLKDLAKMHKNNSKLFNDKIAYRLEIVETDRLNQLKVLQEKFIAAGYDSQRYDVVFRDALGFERTDIKAIDRFLESLTPNEKKYYKRFFNETAPTRESLEELVQKAQSRVKTIEKASNAVAEQSQKLSTLSQTMKELQAQARATYGGATIRDGKLIKPDGSVWKAPKGPKTPEPKVNWQALKDSGITQKEGAAIEYVSGGNVVKKTVQKADLSDEAKKAIEEYTAAHGSKEDAVKKVTDGLKDDVKGLFERVKNNKKLWIGTAAVAAVGAALALMLRPSAKEQV